MNDTFPSDKVELGLFLALLAALALFNCVHFGGQDFVIRIGSEDGPFEYGASLFFLGAAIFATLAFVRSKRGTSLGPIQLKKNFWLLGLALVFFLGFGEEISWGQRVFGFDTPEAVGAVNNQDEFNIHNLSLFVGMDNEGKGILPSVDRMFSLFWMAYCVLVPLTNVLFPPLRTLYTKLALPVPPLWIGLLFPLNYIVTKQWEWRGVAAMFSPFKDATLEIKECYFAVLFCAMAYIFFRRESVGAPQAAPSKG